MNKDELRTKYKCIRDKITNKKEKSEEITNKVIENEQYKKAKTIAIYSSFSSEVDTTLLIKMSLRLGKRVVIPKVINKEEMEFFEIFSLEELTKTNKFGIKEPDKKVNEYISRDDIDVMIVPGLCFDKENNRIGFGKGYYDKYLANADNIFKIGICFKEQMLKTRIPTSDNDIKMDTVIS